MCKKLSLILIAYLFFVSTALAQSISKDDVIKAQDRWAEGIVNISKTFIEKGDYKKAAEDHIRSLYAYDQQGVLFKPTLASEVPFRNTFDSALSYFVKGSIAEDNGFAIRPWINVRYLERNVIVFADSAISMGTYEFTPLDGDPVAVEFSFAYSKDNDGNLRINLHHSSLPYNASK